MRSYALRTWRRRLARQRLASRLLTQQPSLPPLPSIWMAPFPLRASAPRPAGNRLVRAQVMVGDTAALATATATRPIRATAAATMAAAMARAEAATAVAGVATAVAAVAVVAAAEVAAAAAEGAAAEGAVVVVVVAEAAAEEVANNRTPPTSLTGWLRHS